MDLIDSNTLISKIKITSQFLYVKTQWTENNETDLFHMKIFDERKNSWSGTFSKASAEICRNDIDVDKVEYERNLRQALEGFDKSYSYDFIIKPNENIATFRWKKRFEDAVRIDGSLPMYRDEVTETKDSLLDCLVEKIRNMKFLIMEQNKNIENITKDLDKCKQELNDFVNLKSSLEETLYGKFVELLNEKKKRIQLLEENIQ
ncbi:DNA repair protein XRCC4-like [Achroia grisella]|uniref:DNA repair protein XRCC4-like n=1 Tax=Achroia grisella TaxID=688607 RepID=UPI0027D239BA|nr:DNA repair protein XRCC4-like [Achroia grisella]